MSTNKSFGLTGMSIAVAALLTAAPVFADGLTANFDYRIVEKNSDGEEMLVERKSVRPGEMIHYTLTHENGTEDDLSNLVISGPIPEGAVLVSGNESSSVPATFEVQAEMDEDLPGLEWSTLPALRKVVAEDGSETLEPVPAADIVAVRWTLEGALESGLSALNSYRVIVN